MKRWIAYVLGIITGIILTVGFALCVGSHGDRGMTGLELFDTPGECMDYTHLEVTQVLENGEALAQADDIFDNMVLILPNRDQHFYDSQVIYADHGQYFQRVGTFKYQNNFGANKTVPVVKIIMGNKPTE